MLRSALFALGLVIAALPLTGAVDLTPPPVIVVYPLTASAGTAPDAGSNLAIIFANRLAAGGGVVVKPPTPGVERADYLKDALHLGADYYITGYVTPLGSDVSLLIQVVSTYSGTVVFSTTAVVKTYGEAAGQADLIHDAIVRHAGREEGSLDQAPSTSPPAPVASAKPNEGTLANITSIFHHKQSATPRPSPTASAAALAAAPVPAPSASAPASRASPAIVASPSANVASAAQVAAAWRGNALVLPVGGGEQADEQRVGDALVASLKRHGFRAGRSSVALAFNPPDNAAQICSGIAGASMLYATTLTIDHTSSGAADTVHLDVIGYDCTGSAVVRESADASATGKGGLSGALARASDAVVVALTRHAHA